MSLVGRLRPRLFRLFRAGWKRLPFRAKQMARRVVRRRVLARPVSLSPSHGEQIEPLVTVVVASCNRSELLPVALRSVQMQDLPAWECIVVDDASTDQSADIVMQFAAVDPRFRLIVHDERRGLSAVRNTGIVNAAAPWVCFLDDDDLLLAGSLSGRLRAVEDRPDHVAGSFVDWLNIDPGEGLEVFSPRRRPRIRGTVSFASLGAGVPFIATSPMIRTDVVRQLGGFDEAVQRAEDADLWFRLLRAGYLFVDAHCLGVAYRRSPGSLVTGAPMLQLTSMLGVFDRADQAVTDLAGPFPTHAPLSQVAVEQLRSAQISRYLAMVAVAETPERAVAIGRERLSPIVRVAMLEDDTLHPKLVEHCLLRFSMGPADRDLVADRVTELLDGLRPERSSVEAVGSGLSSERPGIEWSVPRRRRQDPVDVVLVPEAAYHVDELAPLSAALHRHGLSTAFMLSPKTVPAAERAIGRAAATVVEFDPDYVSDSNAVVVLNDWGPMRDVVTRARERGVATFGKVEGVQDFDDLESDWERRPYRWVEHVLAQGDNDVRALPDAECSIVGSSRLEQIWTEPPVGRGGPALVNLNFTYRVLTEHRDQWIASVAAALSDAGVAGLVSRHPAERGDTNGLAVADKPFRHEVTRAGLVISRFSTVAFEAMARGVPFVYHNPHGERMPAFLGSWDEFWSTDSVESLAKAIAEASAFDGDYRELCEPFFRRQVDVGLEPSHERAAAVIARALEQRAR